MPARTPSSTTHRSRSGGHVPCPCAGPTRSWPVAWGHSLPLRSRRSGRTRGPTRGMPTSCTTTSCPLPCCPRRTRPTGRTSSPSCSPGAGACPPPRMPRGSCGGGVARAGRAAAHGCWMRRWGAEWGRGTPAVLRRCLLRRGGVARGTQLHGKEGLTRVMGQLRGLELRAPAWEERILPARIQRYNPADLEHLCLSGVVTWGRLSAGGALGAEEEPEDDVAPRARSRRPGPVRNRPLAFVLRADLPGV